MYGADNPFLLTDRFGGVSGAKISILVREIQTLILRAAGRADMPEAASGEEA